MECGSIFDAAPQDVGFAAVPHVGDDGDAAQELAAMRKELAAFRDELAALKGDAPAPAREDMRAAGKREGAEEVVAAHAEVHASCWSIPLVVSFGSSRAEAALLLLLYALNVALQVFFCYIVMRDLGSSSAYDDGTVEELVNWRRTIAHDVSFYDGQHSLAHRVCSGDAGLEVAATQQAQYAQLAAYLGDIDDNDWPAGPWMAAACLVAFTLTMVKELRAAVELLDAVGALPRGATTELGRHREDEDDPDDDTFDVLAISRARLAFAATTLAIRFAVAAVILVYGCRWLCYTVSLSDLLLNAVALEFVVSVDELIFEALAPRAAKARVEGLRPLKRAEWSSRGLGGVDGETLATNVFVAALIAYFVVLELGPQTRILKNARDAICGGDQDFVFTTDGAGVPAWGFPETVDDVHFSRDVNFGDLYGDQDKRTYLQRSVDAVIEQHGRVEVEDCPYDSCFEWDSASCGGDDFREIFTGKTKRNRYRHAW